MTKGKVVLVPFPFDDLSATKLRPAVCLTDPVGPHRHLVLAFITSRTPPDLSDTDVMLDAGAPDFATTGLKVSSVLRLHRLITVSASIIVHSPVKKRYHDTATRLLRFAHLYVQVHDLGFVGHEKIMISLTRNDYEPDVCFFGKEKAQALSPDQMKFPAPDFVAEVLSPSTEVVDRGVKFEDYAAHGVGEYWLLDPDAEVAEQYVLEGDRYVLRMKSKSGQIESAVIAGLSPPVEALFDDGANLREVQRLFQAG